MDWSLLFEWTMVVLSMGALTGFTYRGWIKWTTGENEIEIVRGRLEFFGGIAGMIVVTILVVGFIVINSSIEGPPITPTPSVTPANSGTPIPTIAETGSLYYVERKQYDGAVYSGYIDPDTKLPNGKGKMVYMNGDVYDGDWIQGIQEGYGRMKYGIGDTYDGLWQSGKKEGSGIYTWSDGRKYDGEYKDDKRNGKGTFTGWDGYVDTYGWAGDYNGYSKDDAFEGQGRFVFDNGDSFEGVFSDNLFWKGVYTRKDGSIFLITEGEQEH